MMELQPEEISITCPDGTVIAAEKWHVPQPSASASPLPSRNAADGKRRVLCLHGFMDNCRSFYHLAPSLASNIPNSEVVAIDFPCHGHSPRQSPKTPPLLVLSNFTYYVLEAIHTLGWSHEATSSQITLIGHSMGAAIAIMFAAAYPEQVQQLVILDGYAADLSFQRDPAQQLRFHIMKRSQQETPNRVYASLEDAIRTRQRTATLSPGSQWLSAKAATELVQRSIHRNDPHPSNGNTATYSFHHPPDLLYPHILYLTPQANDAFFRDMQCPTVWIRAKNGWPYPMEWVNRAAETLGITVKTLEGSHHFHADPETCEAVAQYVLKRICQ